MARTKEQNEKMRNREKRTNFKEALKQSQIKDFSQPR